LGWYNTNDDRLRGETSIAHGYSPTSGFGTYFMPLLQKKFSNVSRADFIPYPFGASYHEIVEPESSNGP
jgi:hypothetical protein